MGALKLIEVQLLALATAATFVCCSRLPCETGRSFWDARRGRCLPCSSCPARQVVLAPCQLHRDTTCGPISKLMIDWSWLPRRNTSSHRHSQSHSHSHSWVSSSASKESSSVFSTEEEDEGLRPRKQSKSRWTSVSSSSSFAEESSSSSEDSRDGVLNRTSTFASHRRNKTSHHRKHGGKKHHKHHYQEQRLRNSSSSHVPRRPPPESAAQVKLEAAEPAAEAAAVRHRQVAPEPFSTTEALVWDWQVIVLSLAVCACLLFFVVTGIYSIHHARQWRRLKDNFEADMEELSAQLSLMPPETALAVAAACVGADSGASAGTPASQCAYLEQLLAHKQQSELADVHGNLYIDRNSFRV